MRSVISNNAVPEVQIGVIARSAAESYTLSQLGFYEIIRERDPTPAVVISITVASTNRSTIVYEGPHEVVELIRGCLELDT